MLDATLVRIQRDFRQCFGPEELVVRSPGRVNLIGEHTDYNQGLVLPAAVDKAIVLAVRARADRRCRFFSADLGQVFEGSLDRLVPSDPPWANYLLGVLAELCTRGCPVSGVDCAFGGDLPIGSGMSSSAALECGFALALEHRFGLGLGRVELARLAQRSENQFVGVACGIMDQFACLLSRSQHLIRLDCRDLSYAYVPCRRSDVRIVLCDTQVRRTLAGSEYNLRRTQCEAALAALRNQGQPVQSLRDVTLAMLHQHQDRLDPLIWRRAVYVVEENQRVLDTCALLERGDFTGVGALMNASHRGLASQYEVSSRELDVLQAAAVACPGVLGSRMMGAGFGGCTINLVEEAALPTFQMRMAEAFGNQLGKEPRMHVCQLTGGGEVLPTNREDGHA
jgi:galactokinase